MGLSLKESQAINEMADVLYSFLPGSPHPYAAPAISFPGVAQKLGLAEYWIGGSKKPAITQLLHATLEAKRNLFCRLILELVRTGMSYRSHKGNPITREEIEQLNTCITGVSFKIPELWESAFLDSLPRTRSTEPLQDTSIHAEAIQALRDDLMAITTLAHQARGFAFEKFLNKLFAAYTLKPRKSFRIIGEQIDGSFQIGTETYLLEAKWQDTPTAQDQLLVFDGKVRGKSDWSRGLFISYNGFSSEGLTAFSKGRSTKIIGMNSRDLYFILNDEISLEEVILEKARRAAETGDFLVEVYELKQSGCFDI